MKLRYRLFLHIGSLFILCFVAAVGFQGYFTTRTLKKGEANLASSIEELHKEKREEIIKFLTRTVAQKLGQLEMLLMGIAAYPIQYSELMQHDGSWHAIGELLFSNKWLDFLEHSFNDQVLSSIVVDPRSAQTACITAKAQDLEGIYQLEKEQKKWVAIEVPLAMLNMPLVKENNELTKLYFVFSMDQLPLLKQVQYEIEPNNVLAPVIAMLVERLHQASNPLIWKPLMQPETMEPMAILRGNSEVMKEQVEAMIFRADVMSAIRTLTTILNTHLFGTSPTNPQFPQGVAMFNEKELIGSFIRTDSVLLDRILVESTANEGMGKQMPFVPSVIADEKKRLFLASSLSLVQGTDSSDLIVGASIDDMTKMLSLAFGAPVFCVFKKEIYPPAYSEGTAWESTLEAFPYQTALEQDTGIVDANGCSLFFIRVKPLADIDLHFFTVNLAQKEFEFLNTFEEGTKSVIREILNKMWIVALFAVVIVLLSLNRLAKRITAPITRLATAASAVGKGRLSEVELPRIRIEQSDEVHSLYDSFDEMIQSLKDKEKVRAALNKVVSPTIAAEILKTNMMLGGERKAVCVLFADIRGFSKMTENMQPEQVIIMLNHCMTQVSRIIEENNGVIDKYVGDEVMALFGIPKAKEDDGLHAIKTAVDIQRQLREWNNEREKQGRIPIQMGIGIDIGDVVAGNMGADDRQNYTVLGKHVNLAARFCSIAPPGKIFISEAVASTPKVREQFTIREVGKEAIKGFSEPVLVYEVVMG
jgi:class 3 adenylate cyclase/HAMP domain-containing protein